MADAVSSFGTLLQIGDGGGTETFTTIAEVTDIGGLDLSLETEEVTNHSSPGGWVERIGTLLDAGGVDLEINYLPTNATHNNTTGLIRDMRQRTRRNFRLVFPNTGNTTWTFPALVKSFKPKAPVKGVLRASVKLEAAGQPTLA